jgi:hypothetical protein
MYLPLTLCVYTSAFLVGSYQNPKTLSSRTKHDKRAKMGHKWSAWVITWKFNSRAPEQVPNALAATKAMG